MKSGPAFVHGGDFHPGVEAGVVAGHGGHGGLAAFLEVVLTAENVQEIVQDRDRVRVHPRLH